MKTGMKIAIIAVMAAVVLALGIALVGFADNVAEPSTQESAVTTAVSSPETESAENESSGLRFSTTALDGSLVDESLFDIQPDVMVFTHNHLDHYDPETAPRFIGEHSALTVLAPSTVWGEVRKLGGKNNYVLHDCGRLIGINEALESGLAKGLDEILCLPLPEEFVHFQLLGRAPVPCAESFTNAAGDGVGILQALLFGVPGFQLRAVPAMSFDDAVLQGFVGFALFGVFLAKAAKVFKVCILDHGASSSGCAVL